MNKNETCYNCHFSDGFMCSFWKDVIPKEEICGKWTNEEQDELLELSHRKPLKRFDDVLK